MADLPTHDELQTRLQEELTARHFDRAKQTLAQLDQRFPNQQAEHQAIVQPTLDEWATHALAAITDGHPKDAELSIEQLRLFDATRADKLAGQLATTMKTPSIDPVVKRREELFQQARSQLAAGQYEPALSTLQQIETLAPTTAERDTLQALQHAWQDVLAADTTTVPDDEALFAFHKQHFPLQLPDRLRDTPDESAIRSQWQAVMTTKVEAVIADFDDETDWQALARICVNDVAPSATIDGLLHECWVELVARRGDAGVDGTPLKLDQLKDGNASDYVKQMIALQTLRDPAQSQPTQAAAATSLAQSMPKLLTQNEKWLNPFRVHRLALALAGFAQDYKGRATLEPPYPAKDSEVNTWLTTANDLAEKTKTLMPMAKRLQIAIELLLARWSEANTDADTRKLATTLAAESSLARTLGWTSRDSLRFDIMVAETLQSEPSQRATAYSHYVAALHQPLAADDTETVLPFLDKRIVEPFLKPELLKSETMKSFPQSDRTAAATLYRALGRQLYANKKAWADSGQLESPPLNVAMTAFEQAVNLAGAADDLAWRGLIRSELPKFEFADLQKDAQSAMKADPKNPLCILLDAVETLESATGQTDTKVYLDRLRKADDEFKTSIKAFQAHESDFDEALAIAYRRVAYNAINLANTDQSTETGQAEELSEAVAWAEQLMSLKPDSAEGQNTLGCAYEDQAWLLRSPDRFQPDGPYARADESFRKAIDPTDPLPQVYLNRGRNLFKWAEDKYNARSQSESLDNTKLTQAKAQFQDAIDEFTSSTDDPLLLCESHYWLGKLEMLRLQDQAAIDLKTDLYESAVDHYRKAIDYAIQTNHKRFLGLAVTNLAVAHRTLGLNSNISATEAKKIVERLDELIDGKFGGELDHSHKALLEYNRLYIAVKNKIVTIPLAEFKNRLLELIREGTQDVTPNGVDYALKLLIGAVKSEISSKNLASALQFAQQARDLANNFPTIISNEERAEATAWVGLVQYAQGFSESYKRDALNSEAREQLWTAISLAPRSSLRWKWNLVLAQSYDHDVEAEIGKLEEGQTLSPTGRNKLIAAFLLYRMFTEDNVKAEGRLIDLDSISYGYIDQFNRSRQTKFESYQKQLKDAIDDPKAGSPIDRVSWKLAIAEIDWFLSSESKDEAVFKKLIDQTEPLLKELSKELPKLDDARLKGLLGEQIARLSALVKAKKAKLGDQP